MTSEDRERPFELAQLDEHRDAPVESVVEVLETMLKRARNGQLRGVAVVGIGTFTSGDYTDWEVGADANYPGHRLVYLLETLKGQIMDAAKHLDVDDPDDLADNTEDSDDATDETKAPA